MKKIKILHISETFVTGVYTYIRSICRFTAQFKNIETYVIFSPNREGTDSLNFDEDFAGNTSLIPLSMQREISISADYKSYVQLKKNIKTIEPDVIHLHSSKAGVLGRIAAKAYPKARVYYTPNGYSFLREDISGTKQQLFKLIEAGISKLFGGITIACGETEYHYAKELGKALMVRNGIDLEEVRSVNSSSSQKLKQIVTLGRISAQKNPGLFNKVAENFPEVRFIWIGDGELRHLLTAENINITGWLDRKVALNQLAKYDVYMQTSLWEGLPFTIIEAMAMGKPIIATNVIGNKDAVEDQKNGFLCNDLGAIEHAIQTLLKKPQLLVEYGQQSKILAQEKFDRNKNFKKLVEIYLKNNYSII